MTAKSHHDVQREDLDPEHYSPDNKRLRFVSYLVLGIIFLGLALVALLTFRTVQDNQQADKLADQLIADLTAQGFTPPSKNQITHTLGTDGGAVCADPSSALKQGIERATMSNGAAGPGLRPVFVSRRVLEGELAVIKIYCPDQLDEFTNFVNSHKYADVIKE